MVADNGACAASVEGGANAAELVDATVKRAWCPNAMVLESIPPWVLMEVRTGGVAVAVVLGGEVGVGAGKLVNVSNTTPCSALTSVSDVSGDCSQMTVSAECTVIERSGR
jgi:hypothetical protein